MKGFHNFINKRFFFSFFVLTATLVLFFLSNSFPNTLRTLYTHGMFQVFRVAYDYTFGWLPLPPVILAVGIAFYWRMKRRIQKPSRMERLFAIASNLCWLISLFFWMWGFNYALGPLKREVVAGPTKEELFDWAKEVQYELEITIPKTMENIPESEIRQRLEDYLVSQNWPVHGRVRSRAWMDGGLLRRMGISGIYLPWLMEGHLSATLPVEVLSFVRAHEMSHGYGIAQEGEADYCAYRCLSQSIHNDFDAPALWMANYELWSTLRRELHQHHPQLFDRLDSICPHQLSIRHERVKADFDSYSGAMRDLAAGSNDVYLKSMGVADGIQNYDGWWLWVWQDRMK